MRFCGESSGTAGTPASRGTDLNTKEVHPMLDYRTPQSRRPSTQANAHPESPPLPCACGARCNEWLTDWWMPDDSPRSAPQDPSPNAVVPSMDLVDRATTAVDRRTVVVERSTAAGRGVCGKRWQAHDDCSGVCIARGGYADTARASAARRFGPGVASAQPHPLRSSFIPPVHAASSSGGGRERWARLSPAERTAFPRPLPFIITHARIVWWWVRGEGDWGSFRVEPARPLRHDVGVVNEKPNTRAGDQP